MSKVKLVGTWIAKREEVIDVFRKGKFELLALTETKLEGNGEVQWRGMSGIVEGVQEIERARESVGFLVNDEWHITVINIDSCANS